MPKIDEKCFRIGTGAAIECDKKSDDILVFSFGFKDSIGLGLFAIYKNGLQKAFMVHHKAEKINKYIVGQKQYLCDWFKKGSENNNVLRVVFIFMRPSDGLYDEKSDEIIKTPKYQKEIEALQENVKKFFELDKFKDIKIKIEDQVYFYSGFCTDFEESLETRKFEGQEVEKEFEIVLKSNFRESYFKSKATNYQEHKLLV